MKQVFSTDLMENNQTLLFIFDWLIELRFYVPIDTKQVILETFFLANLLAQYWRTNLTQQKQTIREQNGINERQRNIQKANINVNLNLNEQLTIRTAHKSVGISLCTTVVHNTAENSSDNLPSYPLDNHHSSYVQISWCGSCLTYLLTQANTSKWRKPSSNSSTS